ncbi:urocortin-3-like [Rissa tridactyla]|uniref:urocortin-3-like n=1 Tax=Rissa tridactyla TaxID=75485 RepID=UPI0023BAFB68|nr:urocortin-3-like [Rissa tridactyla]
MHEGEPQTSGAPRLDVVQAGCQRAVSQLDWVKVLLAGPCCRMLITFLVVLGAPARAWRGLSHERLPSAPRTGDGGKLTRRETISANEMLPGLPEMRRSDRDSGEGSYLDKASSPLLEASGRKALPWPMSPATKRPAPRKKVRKVSLSLDVPTHVLKILLDLAREKELQAKAAANAELMARLGRRK